jgi:hypothetical protein
MELERLLTNATDASQRAALFAWLNLGVIDSLACGVLSASDAVSVLYHAENCLYVNRHLRKRAAAEVMSRGVQLPDLFTVLPAEEAQREYQKELSQMRLLCQELLDRKRLVA